MPLELKYHENTGDVIPFAVHVNVTGLVSTRVVADGTTETLPETVS